MLDSLRNWLGGINRDRRFWLLLAAMSVVAVAGSVTASLLLASHQGLLQDGGITVLSAFTLASVLTLTLGLTPSTFVAVVSGYFFGWRGLVAVFVSYPMAATLGLYAGRLLNNRLVGYNVLERPPYKRIFEQLKDRHALLMVFVRLSPILPFAVMNIALSGIDMRLAPYLAGTMAGMLPRTLLAFLAGKNAKDIVAFLQNPQQDGVMRLIPLILLFISLAGMYLLYRRAMRKVMEKN